MSTTTRTTTNGISKKPPLLIAQDPNNSQNTQHTLGVAFSYLERNYLCFCSFAFLFGHIINILLTELGWSVWKNLDLGRWYRPNAVRSVLATSVKILPYRLHAVHKRFIKILNGGYKGKGKQQQLFHNSQLLSYINIRDL